jgi:inosine/xanthosine triphosphate pyrophosphatase family protein
MIEAFTDKTGYAQTIVGFSSDPPGKELAIFDGRTSGTIVMPQAGFGWDLSFNRTRAAVTYAEMIKRKRMPSRSEAGRWSAQSVPFGEQGLGSIRNERS